MALPVDIRGVIDTVGSCKSAAGDLVVADITLGDRTFSFPAPLKYDVTLANAATGIVGSGTVSAVARTQCVRCLCEHDLEVSGEIQGFYVVPGREHDLPDEQDFEHIIEGSVDIEPAIVQAVALALPFAPVHAPDCRGICPSCGADLNVDRCACAPEAVESPFAALKDLLLDGDALQGDDPPDAVP